MSLLARNDGRGSLHDSGAWAARMPSINHSNGIPQLGDAAVEPFVRETSALQDVLLWTEGQHWPVDLPMLQRLVSYWVYGGALSGVLLLVTAPLLLSDWSRPLSATFLLLPAYMIHQYEEHDGDRFRLFFNETMGKGSDVLSPFAVFITNVPGVWGVIVLSLYGAAEVDLGWALVAVYLVLVNAVVHVLHGVIFRRYNPGLVTALVVFAPLGAFALHLVNVAGAGTVTRHVVGLLVAVAIHAAIMFHVRRKLSAGSASMQGHEVAA